MNDSSMSMSKEDEESFDNNFDLLPKKNNFDKLKLENN